MHTVEYSVSIVPLLRSLPVRTPSVQLSLVPFNGGDDLKLENIQRIEPPTSGLLETIQFKDYSVVTESDYVWVVVDDTTSEEFFDPELDRTIKAKHLEARENGLNFASFSHKDIQYTVEFKSPAPKLQNSSMTRSLYQRPPIWYYKVQEIGFIQHEDQASASIEEMYRYGGKNITLGGTQYTFIFSAGESFQVDVNTFEMIEIARYPPITSNPCEIKVGISIQGALESVMEAELMLSQLYYDPSCCIREISFEFPGVDERVQYIILQQIANVTRRYCVRAEHHLKNQTLSTKLEGAPWYVDEVAMLLKSLIIELQRHVVPPRLSGAGHGQEFWEPQTEDCELKPVVKESPEWKEVLDCMRKTLPNIEMVKLERVQNRSLQLKYELEKNLMLKRNNEEVNEKPLFHGSRQIDPKDIVFSSAGVDFRYSSKGRTLLWGAGAYFAVKASYSDNYAHSTPDNLKQLILARVLTGKSYSYQSKQEPSLTKPPQLPGARTGVLYDTVNGETGGSTVYVTYDHDKSYPAYIITYRNIAQTTASLSDRTETPGRVIKKAKSRLHSTKAV